MTERRGGEYKRSLFDKHGPRAADIVKTASWLPVWVTAGGGIGFALAVREELSAAGIFAATLGGAIICSAIASWLVIAASRTAGDTFGAFIQPSGKGSPYERQYSFEDALVMRGDAEGALSSYDRIIAESPEEAEPRLRAAEICVKQKMPERAESYYRGVQRLPHVATKDDVYASNRLVDLYRSWPGHEKKALRELRRLIDTYPGSEIAERARQGLATLKLQLGSAD